MEIKEAWQMFHYRPTERTLREGIMSSWEREDTYLRDVLVSHGKNQGATWKKKGIAQPVTIYLLPPYFDRGVSMSLFDPGHAEALLLAFAKEHKNIPAATEAFKEKDIHAPWWYAFRKDGYLFLTHQIKRAGQLYVNRETGDSAVFLNPLGLEVYSLEGSVGSPPDYRSRYDRIGGGL